MTERQTVTIRVRSDAEQRTGQGTLVFVEIGGVEYEIDGVTGVQVGEIRPDTPLQARFAARVRLG